MKTKSINVLMVDDHKMILKSYAEELKEIENRTENYRFQIEQAYSLLQAIEVLKCTFEKRELHLVLLDIGLPNSDVPGYKSGLELGLSIRKNYPSIKIIVITSFNTYPLIQRLFDIIKPEGILLKGELDPNGLQAAVQDVLEGVPYYTKTVRKFLTQVPAKPNVLDHYDMLILYHLSEGVLTKELAQYLPLSLRSIERRKNKLKDILNLDYKSSDVRLLNRAKEEGFL
ncbi:response regulator [Aequorivita flava]|uniref:Response regulator n=1 Tax=Aequorivita flava TaxID=3114371 RepID=A0AB35YXT6_9FLAO